MATVVHLDHVTSPPPLSPPKAAEASHSNQFESLLRRLSPKKKEATLDKIQTLENKELIFPQIAELAARRDYSRFAQLFSDPDFDYYALAAVEQNYITAVQFGTLMFVRAGLCSGVAIQDIEVISLFDGNAPSYRAWIYIKETFKSKDGHFIMDDRELAQFFELMRKQPPSEQYLVLIPDVRRLPESWNNISVRLNMHAYFNAFCGLEINQKKMRMIPSIGMVQALLDATGDDGFTFLLALDDATPEEIRLTCINENARDLRTHSTIAPAPNTADGFRSPPIDWIFHEIYHLFTSRHVPKPHRNFFNELATVVNPDRFSSRAAKQAAWEIYTTLIDIDIALYRPDNLGKAAVNQMHVVIVYLLDVLVPHRKRYYTYPQEPLTPEELQEYDKISAQLKEKVRGIFAVWCLYKTNYTNFEEISEYFDRLDPQIQQQIGQAFLQFYQLIEHVSQFNIPKERFDRLSPSQITELAYQIQTNFPTLLQLIASGRPVGEILESLRKK